MFIPTDTVVELVKGQKRSTTLNFFPGYMLVQTWISTRKPSIWSIDAPRITSSAKPIPSR